MTVFHYFSDRAEIIQLFQKLLERTKSFKTLTCTQKSLPLQILNPDFNSNTALELSIINQSPRSFEFMIEMLEGFPDIALTKMMLT